jgi:hypothetical protein
MKMPIQQSKHFNIAPAIISNYDASENQEQGSLLLLPLEAYLPHTLF